MVSWKESKEILEDWLRLLSDQSHDRLQTLSNSENQTKTTNDEPHDDTVETDFQVKSVELVDVDQWWSSDSEKYKDKRSGRFNLSFVVELHKPETKRGKYKENLEYEYLLQSLCIA